MLLVTEEMLPVMHLVSVKRGTGEEHKTRAGETVIQLARYRPRPEALHILDEEHASLIQDGARAQIETDNEKKT